MASFTKVNDFVVNLANAMDMNADTFKVALSNTDPTSGTSVVTDGNGVLANCTEYRTQTYQQELCKMLQAHKQAAHTSCLPMT